MQVTADGDLRGLSEVESRADAGQDGEAGVILISQLLWLFLTFLGEATTLRLIEEIRLQVEIRTEPGITSAAAFGPRKIEAFQSLLHQVDRLKSVSEGLETLADKLPDMENGLVSVAGNIRSIAALLDVFAIIRSKSEGPEEEILKQPSMRYVM